MSKEGRSKAERVVIVLDYLPHGRADDERPQFKKRPLAQAVEPANFQLYEVVLESGAALGIGESVSLDDPDQDLSEVRRIEYQDLSGGSRAELDHVVRELVDENEDQFIEFYNEAGPISLRLHQLNLLPGIGDKLRDNILEAREREPFGSFDEMEDRVSGLHDPKEILVNRLLEEIQDEDVKYRLFAREE